MILILDDIRARARVLFAMLVHCFRRGGSGGLGG